MQRLQGIAGAPGFALGKTARVDTAPAPTALVAAEDRPAERLAAIQADVAAHLAQLAAELRAMGNASEAEIFDAQAMLATDSALTTGVLEQMADAGLGLLDAVTAASAAMAASLSALDDDYLRARADDVLAVGQQIVAALGGAAGEIHAPAGAIVIAADLTPAQTVGLRKAGIAGFATAGGTPTGHVAILARALGLPAVVGLGASVLAIPDGVLAILDATGGTLVVEPDDAAVELYQRQQTVAAAAAERRMGLRALPAETTDGIRVALWANIGNPAEAQPALDSGAEGIGLFRTEFLFLDRVAPPSEDEQVAAYSAVVRTMAGRPVVIRTLDVGGDKPIPYLTQAPEANPFLGWRGIRFAIRFRELFATQLRALLRAAVAGDLRILLPMIATAEDVAWAAAELAEAAAILRERAVDFRADVPIGVMVETPAAALTLDLLTTGITFCSIGSNDLAQYVLAADRGDGQLVRRYRHDDPAVLRLIGAVVADARRLGLELSLCGELASEPQSAVALVGLGLDKLSMTATALGAVKEALRAVALPEARRLAAHACELPASADQPLAAVR